MGLQSVLQLNLTLGAEMGIVLDIDREAPKTLRVSLVVELLFEGLTERCRIPPDFSEVLDAVFQ